MGNAPGALRRHRAFRLVLAVAAEQDTSLGPGSPVEHCTGMSATALVGTVFPELLVFTGNTECSRSSSQGCSGRSAGEETHHAVLGIMYVLLVPRLCGAVIPGQRDIAGPLVQTLLPAVCSRPWILIQLILAFSSATVEGLPVPASL